MKILIIHHLEDMWSAGYEKAGYTTETLIEKFVNHLLENQYDRVILTQFENWQAQEEHNFYYPNENDYDDFNCLSDFIDQWECYGYGMEIANITDLVEKNDRSENWAGWNLLGLGDSWAWGGNHSEIVELDQWMKELSDHDVYLSGAFDGECIEDMEIALDALNVDYTRINELII